MNDRTPQGQSGSWNDDTHIIPGDKTVPNIEPPKWALVVMVLIVLAVVGPFLIMLWRWALT